MEYAVDCYWASVADWSVPRRRPDVRESELDGEAVLFDPRSGCTFHCNLTAQMVWRQCDGETTAVQIARMVADEYEVDPETALDDIEQSIALFVESGLLVTEDPS